MSISQEKNPEELEENKFCLKYIKMEPELFLNEKINKTDCLVFCLIELLDGKNHCYAGNSYIANFLNMTTTTVSMSIKRLKEEGYIEELGFDGRKRTLAIKLDYKSRHNQIISELNSRTEDDLTHNTNTENKEVKNVSPYGETCAVAQSSLHDKSLSGKRKKIPLQKSLPTSSPESVKESLSKTPTSLSGHKSKKETQPLSIPKNVQEIFDYWIEMGLQHLPSIGTKNYNDCIQKTKGLLNGSVFDTKFSMEQIKKSIMHFSLAALDREFEPVNLITKKRFSKTTIGDFIYNPFRTNGNSSLFKKYLDAPKENPTGEIIKDKHPQITNALKTFYRKEVVGGAKIHFTQKDENCFRSGAIQLKEFVQNNIKRFNPYVVPHESNLAEWLCEAIKADCREDMSIVSPAWFASGTTFNRRLPAYLYRQALIDDSRGGGVITGTLGDAGADDLQIDY